MNRYSYRFTVASLGVSVMMLVGASVVLVFQAKDPSLLIPWLTPILALLGGLLVSPPRKSNDHTRD